MSNEIREWREQKPTAAYRLGLFVLLVLNLSMLFVLYWGRREVASKEAQMAAQMATRNLETAKAVGAARTEIIGMKLDSNTKNYYLGLIDKRGFSAEEVDVSLKEARQRSGQQVGN